MVWIKPRTLCGVLVYMRGNRFAVDEVGRDAVLVCTNDCNSAQRAQVDLLTPVADDTNDDFLPAILSPELAVFTTTEISDILHDTVHGACEQRVVLLVHRNDDEELRQPGWLAEHLAQRESVVLEVVRIARRSRIAHMCELALVFVYAAVEQFGRHWRVEHKVAVEEPVRALTSVIAKNKQNHTLDAMDRAVAPGLRLRDRLVADIVVHVIVMMRRCIDIVLS